MVVVVQVARAFSRAYGLQLSTRGEMEYAYQGERLTPSLCGRMDQAGPALAQYATQLVAKPLLQTDVPQHLDPRI